MRYENPDFLPPAGGLRAEFARMAGSPTVAPRPLVTLSGWRAVTLPALLLAKRLRGLIGRAETLSCSFTLIHRFEDAAEHLVRRVEREFGARGNETVEVDVVATSMSGLVSRLAAIPRDGRARLRIARLFTLATPHRGAAIANRIAPDPTVRDMRPGSEFLKALDRALPEADYELICYARLRDAWVDARNTAPFGAEPFWVAGTKLWSHHTVTADRLIIADIARRIRGEDSLARREARPPRW